MGGNYLEWDFKKLDQQRLSKFFQARFLEFSKDEMPDCGSATFPSFSKLYEEFKSNSTSQNVAHKIPNTFEALLMECLKIEGINLSFK